MSKIAKSRIKDSAFSLLILASAFGISVLLQNVLEISEHITTLFAFAVFIISLITNGALTKFLIKLSSNVEQSDERIIGSYFHVLNDLERIGDHAENFYEIGAEMCKKGIEFSNTAKNDIKQMLEKIMQMLDIAKDAFENLSKERLSKLTALENEVDTMKKELTANHFARLAEGNCSMDVSPYYSSTVSGLERVADHLVNVGYSIVNPVGSQKIQ